jgi:electron transfer flavoprotein beta subunit
VTAVGEERGPEPLRAVVACVKFTPILPDVDPLDGGVDDDVRRAGLSESDRAAVEVALRLGADHGVPVVAVSVGGPVADPSLVELLATGVTRAVRVDTEGAPSAVVAAHLASALHDRNIDPVAVACGDYSPDGGSGSVPAFLAHELGVAQALGLVEVEVEVPGSVRAVRRLDGARRELLSVQLPAVLSVEGGVADLRRAPLASLLAVQQAHVEVVPAAGTVHLEPARQRPWRPRARVVPAPQGERALDRIVALTGALTERTPPRTIELPPVEAARAILEQLVVWGYLEGVPGSTSQPTPDPVERSDTPPLLG